MKKEQIIEDFEKTIKQEKKNIEQIDILKTYSEPNKELVRIEACINLKKTERETWEEERRLALEETKNIHKWGEK